MSGRSWYAQIVCLAVIALAFAAASFVVAVAGPTDQPFQTLVLSGQSWLVLAIGLTATVAGGTVMFREARQARRREGQLARDGAALAAAYAELAAAKTRAEANSVQLEATLSGMSDGVVMLDANHRLLQWNDRFPEIAGVPREALRVGVSIEEMIHAQAVAGEFGEVDVEAEVRRRMERVHRNSIVGASERARPNGRVLELRRTVLPGGGFVVLYSDITARKQAEEAQRETRRLAEAAVEQKAHFVAMVSHELRVPLNAVISCLALLDQPGLSTYQRGLAETARQASGMLLALVTDILELSKMDAGRLTLRPADFELAALLKGVRGILRVPAAERGMHLALHIAEDVPPRLHADAVRLGQILVNFTSNACKYSRPGTITIRAERLEVDGVPTLRLAVRDQGPCIPEQQAASLFVPFAQLDYTREAGAAGTGLGLAICERLTRLMGGRVGLDPSPSTDAPLGGNEFWVTLPLVAARYADWPDGIEAGRLQRPVRRASVLLVEDVASNRMLTAALLRRDGHRVDVAEIGADAVRLAASRPYDVVFMDLMMPGMDGCETARRIHELPGPEGSVPIVALTARDLPGDPAELLEAGIKRVLAKPIRPDALSEALAEIVGPVKPPPPAPRLAAALPPSLVDAARIGQLQRTLPPDQFANLVDQCIDDMHAQLLQLRRALEGGDADAAAHATHALVGVAGNYGLAAVERRMRVMMAAIKVGDMAAVAAELALVDPELDRSTELVHSMLQPCPA